MHALNGNRKHRQGRPGGAAAENAAERQPMHTALMRRPDRRTLQEPQTVTALRAAGWMLPATASAEARVRVYDTRLEPDWLRRQVRDFHTTAPGRVVYIGGDLLTEPQPLRDDATALNMLRLERWGPPDTEDYHLIVLPRPHQAQWLARGRQQLAVEAEGTVISVLCIVDRGQCSDQWDAASLRRALPGAAVLLEDLELAVNVTAIGERPPLRRVPAQSRQLPPATWEAAFLALNRVLLVVSFHRRTGPCTLPFGRWLGEPPPAPKPSGLELLRVEYLLPPATRTQQAERTLRAALRDLAALLHVSAPAGPQLRQIQVEHGGVVALLEVPRDAARRWLWGSGRAGLFLRPFWTKDTGADVDRSNFALWWLHGHADQADTVWNALSTEVGFVGLLAGGADIAVRVSAEANLSAMQAQVQFKLANKKLVFAIANPAARWWRLGPLSAAEVAAAPELITALGLHLTRESISFKSANYTRTRSYAFFRATGDPVRMTMDDGGWNSSEAQLSLADPPPRRSTELQRPAAPAPSPPVPKAPPPDRRNRPGPALSAQSTWGGPQRTSAAPPSQPVQPVAASPPAPRPPPVPAPTRQSRRARPPVGESSEEAGDVLASRRPRRRPDAGRRLASSAELEDLKELIRALQAELRALRRDNELLRRAQLTDPWRYPGPPYHPAVPPVSGSTVHSVPSRPHTPPRLPAPAASSTAVDPSQEDTLMQVDRNRGPHHRDSGDTPDGKRPQRAARALGVEKPNDD